MADVEEDDGKVDTKSMTKEEKKAHLAAKRNAKKLAKTGGSDADLAKLSLAGPKEGEVGEGDNDVTQFLRTVTGVLTSRPTARDIKIDGFSMGINGQELIQDCSIELTIGRRRAAFGAQALPIGVF